MFFLLLISVLIFLSLRLMYTVNTLFLSRVAIRAAKPGAEKEEAEWGRLGGARGRKWTLGGPGLCASEGSNLPTLLCKIHL